MKKAVITSLVIAVLFLTGCGVAGPGNEMELKHRVEEYHALLLNVTDPEKAANDDYAESIMAYLSPSDPYDAKLKAKYIQNEWLKRNWKAKNSKIINLINIEAVTIGSNGKSAVVNVAISIADGSFKRAEKWIQINRKWYRTLEFTY